MDKSFNDQELSDIMKEIEALEQDFNVQDEKTATPVIEELADLDESQSVPMPNALQEEEVEETLAPSAVGASNVVSFEQKREAAEQVSHFSGASTSMSFKVQGNLTLELQFDIGGKVVCLEVTESGLSIEMEGGMKFSVPVTDTTSFKKAI